MRAKRRRHGATPMREEQPWRFPWMGVFALVLLVGISAAGWLGIQHLADPAVMPVNTVRIASPMQQVSQQQVRELILPHAEVGFLRLSATAVREELEALPWVQHASVRRAWPDVLVIAITEQQAVARWAAGGLLNPQGEMFLPEDLSAWTHLPLLRGPDGTQKQVMQAYRSKLAMIAPLKLQITHVSMDERRAWSLQLNDSLHLGLGRSDVERRLLRFVRVYHGVLEPRLAAIESVDMRYTNGFAIRWRDGMEPPAAA